MRLQMDAAPFEDPAFEDRRREMGNMDDQITAVMRQMEQLGEEGKIDESQAMLKIVDELRAKKAQIATTISARPEAITAQEQEKRMKVCQICGSFLQESDADTRLTVRGQAHLDGKQHIGFDIIRKKITELRERVGPGAPAPPSSRPAGAPASANRAESPRRERTDRDDRRRDSRRSRSRSRDRRDRGSDRGSDRKGSDRGSDRRRSRSRDRRRSRSGDRRR